MSENVFSVLMLQYLSVYLSDKICVLKLIENRYFKRVLFVSSSQPFYTNHVHLPTAEDPIHPFIANNPKFASYFSGALGAIDGTHINCCPSAAEVDGARDCKGNLTQNCLAACTWDMRFVYFVSGWEGAAADGVMYARARITDLYVPPGKVV